MKKSIADLPMEYKHIETLYNTPTGIEGDMFYRTDDGTVISRNVIYWRSQLANLVLTKKEAIVKFGKNNYKALFVGNPKGDKKGELIGYSEYKKL